MKITHSEEEEKPIDDDEDISDVGNSDSEKTQNAISVLNATYLWPYSESIAMSEVTTNIAKGSLTMVMSPDNSFFLG